MTPSWPEEARDRRIGPPAVSLDAFTRDHLAIVAPWFTDPDTRRYLGGPEWPATMLELGERAIGREFREAVQTGAHRYLAYADGAAIGCVDCGTFDRCTVYGGEGRTGPSSSSRSRCPRGRLRS